MGQLLVRGGVSFAGGIEIQTFEDYSIGQSLLFNDNDSPDLTRTPGAESNRRTFTISTWLKRSDISGAAHEICSARNAAIGTRSWGVQFRSDDTFNVASDGAIILRTDAVYRDPSAWYHVVLAVDTTQSAFSDQFKLWINGEQVTSFQISAAVTTNKQLEWNDNVVHHIGRNAATDTNNYADGYFAEFISVDGQALDETSFGEFDATTGIWKPIEYGGTYGTNGFKLDFSDSGDFGADSSGNTNDWTVNNLTATDQVSDSPTNNYCVLNSLKADAGFTFTEANLSFSSSAGNVGATYGTFVIPSTGKWYWEVEAVQNAGGGAGIATLTADESIKLDGVGSEALVYARAGDYREDGSVIDGSYGDSWSDNDIISVLYDSDAGELEFWRNGVSQGVASTGNTGTYVPAVGDVSAASGTELVVNFGQKDFVHTPPAGYQELSRNNLPAPTIDNASEYFTTTLYTGNGTSQSIDTGMTQVDFVWLKERSQIRSHMLVNNLRGATNKLTTNTTSAEATDATIVSSISGGSFTVGNSVSSNDSGETFAAWGWKAGGSGSANTDGTISSNVSVDTTSGVAIIDYTGNGTAGATVGHGLGVAPKFFAVKNLDSATNFYCYHESVGEGSRLEWNTSDAATADTNFLNNTAPTASVIELGGNGFGTNNTGDEHLIYAFAEVEGFSKIGVYTGNGSADGPFVYTGFRPAYVVAKRSSTGGTNWNIADSIRNPENVADFNLDIDRNASEVNVDHLDFLANGFKLRTTAAGRNGNGSTYVFMAFAEYPFKYALAK